MSSNRGQSDGQNVQGCTTIDLYYPVGNLFI